MSAGYIIYSLDWEKFRQLVEEPTAAQLAALAGLLSEGLEEREGEFDEDDPISDWPRDAESLSKLVAQRLAMPDWYGDLSRTGKDLWEEVVFNACSGECDQVDLGFRVDSDGVYWDVIEIAWAHLGVAPNTITDVALSAFGTRPYRYHPSKPGKTRQQHDQDEVARKGSLRALSDFLEDAKQGKAGLSADSLLESLAGQGGILDEHKQAMKSLFSDDDDEEDSEEDDDWSAMHSMQTPDEVKKMLAELQSAATAIQAAKNDEAHTDYKDELLPAMERIAGEDRMLFVQVDT